MIHYNTYDLHKAPKYIDIIEFLGGTEIRDDHVWAIARESHDIPVFENIWYQITLNEIYNRPLNLMVRIWTISSIQGTHIFTIKVTKFMTFPILRI